MIALVILLFLFTVLTYLFLAPIILYIDTQNDKYFIQQQGIIKASVLGDKKEVFKIKLNILFLNFNVYPLRSKNDNSKSKRKRNMPFSFSTGLRLLKSFKVKKFRIDIDTGDCIANAKLYPVFAFLNYKIGDFNINFEDRNQLVLHIEIRPIHIIKSFINF